MPARRALMKLDLWPGASGEPRASVPSRGLHDPVQSPLVHLVKRSIHPSGEHPFDEETASKGEVHEISDRAHAPERHQRAEVAVDEWLQGLSLQPSPQLLGEVRSLLMGGLGARGHRTSSPSCGTAAQSPIAKMSGSRVVRSVASVTS